MQLNFRKIKDPIKKWAKELNTDLLLGGAGGKDVTAVATDRGLFVLGMDTFLHFVHLFLIK